MTNGDSNAQAAPSDVPPVPQAINVVPPTPDLRLPEETASGPSTEPEHSSQTMSVAGDASASRPASWWDYIGWSGQAPEDPAKASEAELEPVADDDPQPSSGGQTPRPADATAPLDAPVVQEPLASTDAAPSEEIPTTEKAPSVFSAETARSQASAWYSPWAWYPSSANLPAAADSAAIASGSGAPEAESSRPEGSMTESEKVKEEALARDQEPPASTSEQISPSEQAPVTVSLYEPSNPIQASISDNRSGWLSLFSSRSLTVKTITDGSTSKQDEGMEVMEIDDEPSPTVAIEVPIGKGKVKDAPRQRSAAASPAPLSLLSVSPKPSLSSSPPPTTPPAPKSPNKPASPSAPPKEQEPKKQEPPAPPLTDSEPLKRDTVRASSPASSKSASGAATPRPAAPNLVLPTWGDTFHTAPRSHPPPARPSGHARSKLTGALSYVAGALFSGEGGRARAKSVSGGKGKQREQRLRTPEQPDVNPEILAYGQDLPKALDVVGEQLNPYILNGGCRVVVIGVAGWSPGKSSFIVSC